MARITITELQKKLEQKENTINTLLEQIHRQNERYSNIVTQDDYNTLQGQYRALQERYNILQGLYDKAVAKHPNHAGRKPKTNIAVIKSLQAKGLTVEKIARELNLSKRTVFRMLKSDKIKMTPLY
mgnify:CR=1 FL=1